MISLIFAACPASTPIYNNVPSSYPTTSIVALSVSTSAKTSSLFTASPTFLFQLTILPSVMVSLNKGILISLAPAGNATFAAAGAALAAEAAAAGAGALGAAAGASP